MSLISLVGRGLMAAHLAQATGRAAQEGALLLALGLVAYGFAFLAAGFAAVAASVALAELMSWPAALSLVAAALLAITLALGLTIGLRLRGKGGNGGPLPIASQLPVDQIADQLGAAARSHPLLAGLAALAAGALAGSVLTDRRDH